MEVDRTMWKASSCGHIGGQNFSSRLVYLFPLVCGSSFMWSLILDISIWLHQVVKGFQDNKGAALNNAHLLGLFHRLCKLMYYRVKPVFVFDGSVPQLKRDTIVSK